MTSQDREDLRVDKILEYRRDDELEAAFGRESFYGRLIPDTHAEEAAEDARLLDEERNMVTPLDLVVEEAYQREKQERLDSPYYEPEWDE